MINLGYTFKVSVATLHEVFVDEETKQKYLVVSFSASLWRFEKLLKDVDYSRMINPLKTGENWDSVLIHRDVVVGLWLFTFPVYQLLRLFVLETIKMAYLSIIHQTPFLVVVNIQILLSAKFFSQCLEGFSGDFFLRLRLDIGYLLCGWFSCYNFWDSNF